MMMTRYRDDAREALLGAARRLVAAEGVEALTIRRIAREADLSTMNLYSRFGGKEALIDELDVEARQGLLAILDSVPCTDDALRDLAQLAKRFREFAVDHPADYLLLFRPSCQRHSEDVDDVGGLSRFTARVLRCQQAGQIVNLRPEDAQDIAAGIWALCHGFVLVELAGLSRNLGVGPSAFEVGLDATLAGLRVPSVKE